MKIRRHTMCTRHPSQRILFTSTSHAAAAAVDRLTRTTSRM
ncbi:hypothetical protein CBW46_018045 [Paenibacillus xerothermodurans]|uniref:Uncharacterized protein n=1 Tax=Paenibacillus xerothermodurans TaxID=1977292 RepID=A0A2W1NK50_PAEXE|nr:hypothetical protein CBW46_018045 [Paenibacillus xerothermodurans]